MRLKRVTIKGFMRFKDSLEIQFPENQVTLVAGENGAGKTSILDSICVSLYGKTFRTSGRTTSGYLRINDLVNHESNEASIRVEFENHGHNYVVTRKIAQHDSDGQLFEDGESKALGQHVYEYVRNRAIGLDWEGFRKSTIVLQGEMSSLTELDPSKRKDAFVVLFGLDKYFDYERRAQEKAKVKQSEAEKIEEVDKILSSDIRRVPEVKLEIQHVMRLVRALENKKRRLSEKVEQEKKEKDDLEGDYNHFVALEEKLKGVNGRVSDAKNAYGKSEWELKNLQRLEKKLPNLEASYNEVSSLENMFSKLEPIKSEYDRLERGILQRNALLKRAAKGFTRNLADITQSKLGISALRKQIPPSEKVNSAENSLEKAWKAKSNLEKREAGLEAEIKGIEDSVSGLRTDLERVRGRQKCPVCLQRITDPDEVYRHYSGEIRQLHLERRKKKEEFEAMMIRLQAVSGIVAKLKSTLRRLQDDAAKKGELKRELRRLSTLKKSTKSLRAEIRKLRLNTEKTRGEQKRLGFNPTHYDRLRQQIMRLRKRKAVERFTSAKTKLTRIPQVKKELSEFGRELSELHSDRANCVARLNELGKVRSLYNKAKTYLEQAQEALSKNNSELAVGLKDWAHHRDQLRELNEKARTLADNQRKIRQLGAERIVLEELRSVFNNIPENILRRLRPFIEKEGTDIIHDLSNSELTALNIEEETLNVAATMNGQIRPIHYFSGGQKTRINMALRVAISRILSKLPHTEDHTFAVMQTLFIDEGDFGNLDEAGVREAIAVVRNLTKEFSRVVLISHIDAIREIFHGYTVEVFKTGMIESVVRTPEIDGSLVEEIVAQ